MSEGEPTRRDVDLFGVPLDLRAARAAELRHFLRVVGEAQLVAADLQRLVTLLDANSLPTAEELQSFRTWFDPTAKGERVRGQLAKLPVLPVELPSAPGGTIMSVGEDRYLVTPEGWLVLRCLNRAEHLAKERSPLSGPRRRISDADARACTEALLDTYRGWTRRRINDVVGLLTSETSTLRPAAAGLLLTLLINRNTAPDRALRRPSDPAELALVANAIASPALAYAENLSGRKNSMRSLDLYRGWALGELRRRLGPHFHTEQDEGIWLEEAAVEDAIRRLVEDVRRRDENGRSRVPDAVHAALSAYDEHRPELAGLGLAFERPAHTRKLVDRLIAAATTLVLDEPDRSAAASTPT